MDDKGTTEHYKFSVYLFLTGLLSLSLPTLLMLNIDWTCATEKVSIDTLREQGNVSL